MTRILVVDGSFSSAHFYRNEAFSRKENQQNFGRCDTPFGHGHNYRIEVGFLINPKLNPIKLQKLNLVLKKSVFKFTDILDHQHLNFVIPEFKKTIPTTENILIYFEKKIINLRLKTSLSFIRLFESENLGCEKYYVT